MSPAMPGCQPSPAATMAAEFPDWARHDLRLGRLKRGAFQLLAFAIEPVEFFGDRLGFQRIGQRQEPGAERGVADPASGIDARTDQKAEMIGVGRSFKPRDVEARL